MRRENLLIGGTGTLGRALLDELDPEQCIVFSRDELKQHELRHTYPGIKTVIGDIRDPKSLEDVMEGIRNVYHVAALKHVDILEENPYEAHRTNVLGTMNSAEAAKKANVQNFYFTSTDKAVLPINVYGMTKAIAERYLLNQNRQNPFSTKFRVFRWGNILGSRGSVLSLFANSLLREKRVYITDIEMTRFWMRITDAVQFMMTFEGDFTEVCFPQMKAAQVIHIAYAVADLLNIEKFDTKIVGIRKGEKIHECLYSSHDDCIRSDTAPRFRHDELVELIGPILKDLGYL